MDDSEDIVKPRRSTRTTGTSGVAKDDGDAIAASDAHAPTKKKKKIVKRKVVKRKLIKSTSGTDDGGSDSSIASPRKKVVKKKIVKRKVTKSISTDSNDASSGMVMTMTMKMKRKPALGIFLPKPHLRRRE